MSRRWSWTIALCLTACGAGASQSATPSVVVAPVASSAAPDPSVRLAPLPVASSSASARPKPPPIPAGDRGDLDASIDLAIAMLERHQYREFLEEFVSPADLPKLEKEGGIDGILPQFARDKADDLLQMLRSIRGTPPLRTGNRAVYRAPHEIVWELDRGRWYIRD